MLKQHISALHYAYVVVTVRFLTFVQFDSINAFSRVLVVSKVSKNE